MELHYAEGKLKICGTPHHFTEDNSELGHLYFAVELPEQTKLKLFDALKAELFPTVPDPPPSRFEGHCFSAIAQADGCDPYAEVVTKGELEDIN